MGVVHKSQWDKFEKVGRGQLVAGVPAVFSKDGKHFFVAAGESVVLHHTETGIQGSSFTGHSAEIRALSAHPVNHLQMVSGDADGVIKWWDSEDLKELRTRDVGASVAALAMHKSFRTSLFLVLEVDPLTTVAVHDGRKVSYRPRTLADPKAEKSSKEWHMVAFSVGADAASAKLRLLHTETHFPSGSKKSRANLTDVKISPCGKNVVMFAKKRIVTFNIPTGKTDIYDHSSSIHSLQISPSDSCVAVGDAGGNIHLVYLLPKNGVNPLVGKKRGKKGTTHASGDLVSSTVSWHSRPVSALQFTADGAYMLSGGDEGVLVVWQLATGAKTFLSKMGAAISSLAISPCKSRYVLNCADSSSRIVCSAQMKVLARTRAFTAGPSSHSVAAPLAGSLKFTPTQRHLVKSSSPGSVEVCSLYTQQVIGNLSVTGRTHVAVNGSTDKVHTAQVKCVAFSPSGITMASVENKSSGSTAEENTLRFFTRLQATSSAAAASNRDTGAADLKHQIVPNTVVNSPAGNNKVSDLVMSPVGQRAVTCSTDGIFRIWGPVRRPQLQSMSRKTTGGKSTSASKFHQEYEWACVGEATYRSFAARSVAFSKDGDVLAVAHGQAITLWRLCAPILGEISVVPEFICALAHEGPSEVIFDLEFLGSSHVVARSRRSVTVWSLLTLRVQWSLPLATAALTVVDPAAISHATKVLGSAPAPLFAVTVYGESAVLTNGEGDAKGGLCAIFGADSPTPFHAERIPSTWSKIGFVDAATLTAMSSDGSFFSLRCPERAACSKDSEDADSADLQAAAIVSTAYSVEAPLALLGVGAGSKAQSVVNGGKSAFAEHGDDALHVVSSTTASRRGTAYDVFRAPSHTLPPVAMMSRTFITSLRATLGKSQAEKTPRGTRGDADDIDSGSESDEVESGDSEDESMGAPDEIDNARVGETLQDDGTQNGASLAILTNVESTLSTLANSFSFSPTESPNSTFCSLQSDDLPPLADLFAALPAPEEKKEKDESSSKKKNSESSKIPETPKTPKAKAPKAKTPKAKTPKAKSKKTPSSPSTPTEAPKSRKKTKKRKKKSE